MRETSDTQVARENARRVVPRAIERRRHGSVDHEVADLVVALPRAADEDVHAPEVEEGVRAVAGDVARTHAARRGVRGGQVRGVERPVARRGAPAPAEPTEGPGGATEGSERRGVAESRGGLEGGVAPAALGLPVE